MRNTLKRATRLVLAVAVAGSAACGGDSEGSTGPSTPPPATSGGISGSYALTQVRTLGNLGGGGSGLPVTFTDGSGDHLVFQSGALTLGADGRFDLKVQVTFNGSGSELTDYGTYSVSGGGTIDFDSEKETARLSNGLVYDAKITLNGQVGGIPFEFDVQR